MAQKRTKEQIIQDLVDGGPNSDKISWNRSDGLSDVEDEILFQKMLARWYPKFTVLINEDEASWNIFQAIKKAEKKIAVYGTSTADHCLCSDIHCGLIPILALFTPPILLTPNAGNILVEAYSPGVASYPNLSTFDKHNLRPTQVGINMAMARGKVLVLKKFHDIIPQPYSVLQAIFNERIESLIYIECTIPELIPKDIYSLAEEFVTKEKCNLEVFQWLFKHQNKKRPIDSDIANLSFSTGNKQVVTWLKSQNICVNDVQPGFLIMYNDIEGVKEYSSLNSDDANLACSHGRLEILKILAERGIYANSSGANRALEKGHTEVVHWLAGLTVPIYTD